MASISNIYKCYLQARKVLQHPPRQVSIFVYLIGIFVNSSGHKSEVFLQLNVKKVEGSWKIEKIMAAGIPSQDYAPLH